MHRHRAVAVSVKDQLSVGRNRAGGVRLRRPNQPVPSTPHLAVCGGEPNRVPVQSKPAALFLLARARGFISSPSEEGRDREPDFLRQVRKVEAPEFVLDHE